MSDQPTAYQAWKQSGSLLPFREWKPPKGFRFEQEQAAPSRPAESVPFPKRAATYDEWRRDRTAPHKVS